MVCSFLRYFVLKIGHPSYHLNCCDYIMVIIWLPSRFLFSFFPFLRRYYLVVFATIFADRWLSLDILYYLYITEILSVDTSTVLLLLICSFISSKNRMKFLMLLGRFHTSASGNRNDYDIALVDNFIYANCIKR